MQVHHLIDGAQVHSKQYFQTLNPAAQEPLAEVACPSRPISLMPVPEIEMS
jgi:hypothetical protein